MFNLFSKLFGTKSERDLKTLLPYVEKVNTESEKLKALSNDELRNESEKLKAIIREHLKPLDDEISGLNLKAVEEQDVDEKEKFFKEIDELQTERDKELEKVLLEILPNAFAITKETARRFKEFDQLEVSTTQFDKEIAEKKPHVVVNGEMTQWSSTWQVMSHPVKWDMVHYDVQLIGGLVLHQGKIAEMATGEGKTLVATLPAFLNALAGQGVHIVTVNDYLAKRDAEWNAPLFEFHGLWVDCIDRHQPNTMARRNAYRADITYGTNNEFGFDYLRDNMAKNTDELVQRKHHFAMVDEVDSVLVDDARTPLIISGPIPKGDEQEFIDLKPRIGRVVEAQRKLAMDFLNDAKKKIAAGDKKEGGLALFRVHRGMPKYRPLIKYLSEPGVKALMHETEGIYLAENQKLMPEADQPLHFTIDERHNSIELTEKGIDFLTNESEASDFFILPDMAIDLNAIEKDAGLSEQERVLKKEELIKDYSIKTQRIHTVNQLLKAYTLFDKDIEYVIMDGKVKIVDEQTGRIMEGRRYSDGLHQAIEAKEGVKVEDATQTYATITLQNYFRMYHKLSGMTGTAETEAGEFWQIYKLDVVSIPTNVNVIRGDEEDKIYRSVREKYNAVTDEIVNLVEQGRPVLVGTTSVENSEIISRMLTLRKIPHQVLNAKQHQREAEVVTLAGQPGTVTIATNMAGRGTDIKLNPDSRSSGGLAIIGTERHESRRVDRQLRGRSGRQGDPGSSQFFVSLEDNLMRLFGSDRMAKVMDRMGVEEGEVIQHSMMTKSIERAQKKVEENNFGIRKRLLEYDDVMNYQRDAIYKRRKNALFGDRLAVDIANTLFDVSEEIAANTAENYAEFELACLGTLGIEAPVNEQEFTHKSAKEVTALLYHASEEHYFEKNRNIANKALPVLKSILADRGEAISDIMVPFTDGVRQIGVVINLKKSVDNDGKELILQMEKGIVLALIDQEWKEHLREMDDLKQSVQNAVFEQKDPLLIYKFESVKLFKQFLSKVNFDVISFLMKSDILQEQGTPPQIRQAPPSPKKEPKLETNRAEIEADTEPNGTHEYARNKAAANVDIPKVEPVKVMKIADRNQRVNVQYKDGRVLKDVKYKKVVEDIERGSCVII